MAHRGKRAPRVNMASGSFRHERQVPSLPESATVLHFLRMTEQVTSRRAASGRRAHYEEEARMVVAVEATRLAREVRGIGRYVRALLPRLLEQRRGLHLLLFVNNLKHA